MRFVYIRVFHQNMFLKKKYGSTSSASIWGLVWRNPKGFLFLTSIRGCTLYICWQIKLGLKLKFRRLKRNRQMFPGDWATWAGRGELWGTRARTLEGDSGHKCWTIMHVHFPWAIDLSIFVLYKYLCSEPYERWGIVYTEHYHISPAPLHISQLIQHNYFNHCGHID